MCGTTEPRPRRMLWSALAFQRPFVIRSSNESWLVESEGPTEVDFPIEGRVVKY